MLCKTICKNCSIKSFEKDYEDFKEHRSIYNDDGFKKLWFESRMTWFEERWTDGKKVSCPKIPLYDYNNKSRSIFIDINKQPPPECPYQLEHLIADQKM